MVVMTTKNVGFGQGALTPVAGDIIVDEIGPLVGVECLQVLVQWGLDKLEEGLTAEESPLADCVVEVWQAC